MPWPPGLVLKNGVNRLACASAVSPAPLSSTTSVGGSVFDVARIVTVPPAPSPSIASTAFLTTLRMRLLELRRIGADTDRRRVQLPPPGDPAGLRPGAEERHHALEDRHQLARLRAGGGRRNTSAKPFMNVFSCPVRAITTPSAVSKSVRFSGDSSRA